MNWIALLTGGSTPERDVALAGAAQVVKALRTLGHEVIRSVLFQPGRHPRLGGIPRRAFQRAK